ncbi:MAG: radical SAM family RiPP maturation amino acid epimerase [Acidobacteriaceae bacterium]|nr:radical SAM family RiPP maturation amino acid epimerase [Acidobacteriaceae bacterium]
MSWNTATTVLSHSQPLASALDSESPHASVPHTKRFLEYWTADEDFRRAYDTDPVETVTRHGLQVDAAKLRSIIDPNGIGADSDEAFAYRCFIRGKLQFRNRYRVEGAPSNPRFAIWRQRQMQRVYWELGPVRSESVVHAPICFELSKGCTVGCWFCGVAAEPFGGNFEYTAENAGLWRGILEAVRELVGPGAGCGFCYWATDPLDNPDYEKFILDFHKILGRLPQTTTAQPLRDLPRTRALLATSARLTHGVERFSVLSVGQFRRIMEAFTPEELTMVELIPQFNSNASPKASAGAVRERLVKLNGAGVPKTSTRDTEDGGSIACVSGFLVNMVERVARLISPCSANQRWPLGYVIFDEFHFNTPSEFRAGVEAAIAHAMKTNLDSHDPVRLNPLLKMERHPDGITLSNAVITVKMASQIEPVVLPECIERGALLSEIADTRAERCGVPHLWTHHEIDAIWRAGVLDEEPFVRPRAAQ